MARHKLGGGLTVETHASGFQRVMKSANVSKLLRYQAARAKMRAESVSGMHFGYGVDLSGRYVSARGWVGARNINPRTGKPNAGMHAKQVEALSKALHGV